MRHSKYPLCRFLQEAVGKPIREIAKLAGIDERQLLRACKEGRIGNTILKLTKIVPCDVLKEYILEAYKMKASKEIEKLEKKCRKGGKNEFVRNY